MLRGSLILLFVLALAVPAAAGGDDGGGGSINIVKPEPGAAPKHRARKPTRDRETETAAPKGFGVKQDTRRGSSNSVYPTPLPGPQAPLAVPQIEAAPRRAVTPPPLFVPETGRTLPNLPTIGAGPGGSETTQDKSLRCAHQAGVYGPSATGNPAGYIGSCINQ
jgi:hypothetical protein